MANITKKPNGTFLIRVSNGMKNGKQDLEMQLEQTYDPSDQSETFSKWSKTLFPSPQSGAWG